jgi:hypothetical protein
LYPAYIGYIAGFFQQTALNILDRVRERDKARTAGSVKTIGMDQEQTLFCVLHHPMDAEETHKTRQRSVEIQHCNYFNVAVYYNIVTTSKRNVQNHSCYNVELTVQVTTTL